jgi:tRNA(Ile)-lysidine synthase
MRAVQKWSPLHHDVWRTLQDIAGQSFKKSRFLLCVSGGADSTALFHIMKDLPLDIEVFHAHHGPGSNLEFRDQAQNFVAALCKKEKIPFHLIKAKALLKSENEMRKFRRLHLKKWMETHPDSLIVMAHHFQDLLETRLMRLIRGTGPQGLQGMRIWKAPVFRPFLEIEASELREFLKSRDLQWCEDPSNKESRYFRNWLRYQWLPVLEKARPGSLKRLAFSLENLADLGVQSETQMRNAVKKTQGQKAHYLGLNQKEQIQFLALLLKSQGLSEFSLGQLKEVRKRLDKLQGRLTFKVAGALWSVNAERIMVKAL